MILVVVVIVASLGLLGSLIGAASEKTELLRVLMAVFGAGLFVGCLCLQWCNDPEVGYANRVLVAPQSDKNDRNQDHESIENHLDAQLTSSSPFSHHSSG